MSEQKAHEKDQDCGKGAVEQSEPGESGNTSLAGQLGHRGQPALVKQSDTDFPEPGENPEHTGEKQGMNGHDLDDVA